LEMLFEPFFRRKLTTKSSRLTEYTTSPLRR